MRGLLELLSAKIWQADGNGAEKAFVQAGTIFTPPTTENQADGTSAYYRKWRFVRIQAHTGDVLVNVATNAAAAAPTAGQVRVFSGTSEIFQLPDCTCSVNVASVLAGGCNGAVIWGR